MSSDTGLLEALQHELRQRGVTANVDTQLPTVPVLYVPVPHTVMREMVSIVHRSERYYQWEGATWPVEAAGELADRLRAHVESLVPAEQPRRWSR